MKIKNLFLLLFIGVMIGVSSCKKAEDQPPSAVQTPGINAKPVSVVNAKSTNIDDINNQMNWFETKVIKNNERDFFEIPLNSALWYWENYLNLRYAYPEKGGNSVNVKTTNISVQLTDGKVSKSELQRVFNRVLAITDDQFKIAGSKEQVVSKQLQLGHFELVSNDGGNSKAIVKYISVIKYDNGVAYKAKDNPFNDGDDWFWGRELGRYPDHADEPEDATTQITHYAMAHFGLVNGYHRPLFWSQISDTDLTTYPRYWRKTPYSINENPQPHLGADDLNLYYNRYIDDIQLFLDENNTTSLVSLWYYYWGNGDNSEGSYADHHGRITVAYPIHLPQAIGKYRLTRFVE